MSKKPTIRDSIMMVVDTVELHNPRYKFRLLEQAADKLATHYESKKDTEAELALREFLDSFPLSCTHSTKDITDYLKEGYSIMDSLTEFKVKFLNSLGQLIGDAEAVVAKKGKKMNPSIFEDSMNVYNLINSNHASGDLMKSLTQLLNGLSEIFDKEVVSEVKSEQEGGVINNTEKK